MRFDWNRAVRVASLAAFAVACGLAYHRLKRTPEQSDLTRYVERELPKLFGSERPIEERIDQLGHAPGLPPAAARALLIDDVIPRLVRLRKQIDEVRAETSETRALNDEYRAVTDQLVAACRTCVRIIDDPKLSTASGVAEVRRAFENVRLAYRRWDEHVRQACARHRLAPPELAR